MTLPPTRKGFTIDELMDACRLLVGRLNEDVPAGCEWTVASAVEEARDVRERVDGRDEGALVMDEEVELFEQCLWDQTEGDLADDE